MSRLHPAAVALLAVVACASEGESPALFRPPTLRVAQGAEPEWTDAISLSWAPGSPFAGFVVEGRWVPGQFVPLHDGNLPPSARSAVVFLDPTTPELTDFEFRVWAVHEDERAVSNVVAFHRGIRPPSGLAAWAGATGCALSWRNDSEVADALVLERRAVQPDGSAGAWAPIAALPGEALLDADLAAYTDGASYEYRLAAALGAERSAWTAALTAPAPLAAPEPGPAAPFRGGVRLAFSNRSRWATEVQILRAPAGSLLPGQEVAVVAASAASWDDAAGPPGLYRYTLIARASGPAGEPLVSGGADLLALSAPPESWGMDARLVTIPAADVLARAPDGAFAAAGRLAYDPWFRAPGTAGDVLEPPAGTSGQRSGIVVGPDGHAHTVYVLEPAAWDQPAPIVHAWHDGVAWREEEIARRALPSGRPPEVRFALGPDGALHVSWLGAPQPGADLEVARRVGPGAWEVELVATDVGETYYERWQDHVVVGDGTGAPRIVVVRGDGTLLHFAASGGVWAPEEVPTGEAVWPATVHLLAGDGDVALAYVAGDGLTGVRAKALRRTPAGWGTPETFGPFDGIFTHLFDAATSADGTRLAMAAADGPEGRVWVADGGVQRELRFFTPGGKVTVGFGADGRAWVLVLGGSGYPSDLVDAVLFEEW